MGREGDRGERDADSVLAQLEGHFVVEQLLSGAQQSIEVANSQGPLLALAVFQSPFANVADQPSPDI